MESLRRLRIVWFVLCCIAAAFIALAAYGGTPLKFVAPLAVGLTVMANAARTSTWFGAMSSLWVGTAISWLAGPADDPIIGFMFMSVGYILFAVAVWIIRPMLKGGAQP